MPTFSEWERQAQAAMKQPETNHMKCTSCGSQYFEQVMASRFHADETIVPGQGLRPMDSQRFLRCVRCDEIFEPIVNFNQSSPEGKLYNEFRDTMEGKGDLRKKPEEEKKDA